MRHRWLTAAVLVALVASVGAPTAIALDNPPNQKFARAFEARAGTSASYYSEACCTGARWIAEAIKAVNGKVEDRDALLAPPCTYC